MGNIIDNFLNDELEWLQEARARNTMIKDTRKHKLARTGGGQSMKIARDKNDPLYKKYMMWREKTLALKKRLQAKYGKRGIRAARQKMR